MDLEKLSLYAAQRFEGIRLHQRAACEDFDEEAIHQMRVEVKQLKALYDLLSALRPGFDAKLAALPIRPIYKSAGRIRDLQVQAGLARAWTQSTGTDLEAYCRHLQERATQATSGLQEAGASFEAWQLDEMQWAIDELLESLSARRAQVQCEAFLEGLLNDLLQRGRHAESKNDLHPLRIFSKRARHTAELLSLCLTDTPPSPRLLETLTAMEQALGQWHDCQVGLVFVETFRQESGDWGNCGEYAHHLRREQGNLRDSFIRSLGCLGSIWGVSRRDAEAQSRGRREELGS